MKLIFTRPHKDKSGEFSSFWIGSALKGYLQYRNIFIGNQPIDFDISYNDLYHFYDISLFEISGNIGCPGEHIEETIKILVDDGWNVNISSTWRWEGKKQIKGKRLWIKSIL
jgi:hypothetical protein